MVPTGKREAVLGVLDEEDVDYAVSEETSGRDYAAIVSFPLPTAAVEPILDDLRGVGIERDAYTVVVQAETVVSERFEALEERFESDEEEDNNGDRIAREELVARASDMAPTVRPYVLMTAVSAIVATAGLLLDSPAVVVGSMVIAPLIGPAMAASVGTVVDDSELALRGVKLQALGGGLAIGAAAVFAFLVRVTNVVPLTAEEVFAIGEVRERLAPDVLSLVIALGAGAAGAVSLASGVSSALVGVMIAAALVPPTAVVGIGIAWWMPQAVIGASVLVLVNVLSINLAALLVLRYEGYQPEDWLRFTEARVATLKRIAVLAVAIGALSLFLGATTYATYQTAVFEDRARATVESVMGDSEAELLAVEYRYRQTMLYRDVDRVVVTIGVRAGVDPPTDLAAEIDRRLTAGNGESVAVEVRSLAIETSDGAYSSKGNSISTSRASIAASRMAAGPSPTTSPSVSLGMVR